MYFSKDLSEMIPGGANVGGYPYLFASATLILIISAIILMPMMSVLLNIVGLVANGLHKVIKRQVVEIDK
jgi:hypothetical protein